MILNWMAGEDHQRRRPVEAVTPRDQDTELVTWDKQVDIYTALGIRCRKVEFSWASGLCG